MFDGQFVIIKSVPVLECSDFKEDKGSELFSENLKEWNFLPIIKFLLKNSFARMIVVDYDLNFATGVGK